MTPAPRPQPVAAVVENLRGRAPSPVLALLAALPAILLAVLLLPAPALAHDTLVSADPEDGASVATMPEEITLTYSADILDVSPVVRLADADGEVVAELEPVVDGPEVTAAVEDPLPAGDYQVQWRVVSSDGHPIEGTQHVTVTEGADDPGASAAPAPSDGGATATEDQTTAGATPPEPTAAEDEGSGGSSALLIGVIVVAVLVVVVGGVLTLRRRG